MGWAGKDVSVVYPPYVSVTPFEEEKYKLLMIGSVRLRDIVLSSPVNHAIISRPVVALVDCQTPVHLRAAGELVRSFSPAQQPFSLCKSDQSLGVCAEGRGRRGLGEEQKDSKSRLLLPSLWHADMNLNGWSAVKSKHGQLGAEVKARSAQWLVIVVQWGRGGWGRQSCCPQTSPLHYPPCACPRCPTEIWGNSLS